MIIGILSAVAVPMYKKATEKSKVSEALLVMDTVAKGQQDWYMLKDSYTTNFANLSTDLIDKDGNPAQDDNYETNTYSYSLKETGILSERNNKEYMLYLDYETKQIMCTPSEHYICKDFAGLTEQPCKSANLSWANTNSTCYSNDEARCKGLYDDSVWNGEFCGYKTGSNHTLTEGMICDGTNCKNSIIKDGGVCTGTGQACQGSIVGDGGKCIADNGYLCSRSTITAGGECISSGYRSCQNLLIKEGGICLAKGSNDCANSIVEGTCKNGCTGSTLTSTGICEATITSNCSGMIVYGKCLAKSNWGCYKSTFKDGGACYGEISGGCAYAKIQNGGICYANTPKTCFIGNAGVSYSGTGCCSGEYCSSNVPKCSCPIDESTGMHKTSC